MNDKYEHQSLVQNQHYPQIDQDQKVNQPIQQQVPQQPNFQQQQQYQQPQNVQYVNHYQQQQNSDNDLLFSLIM